MGRDTGIKSMEQIQHSTHTTHAECYVSPVKVASDMASTSKDPMNGDDGQVNTNMLVKKLYGVLNDRGNTVWLDECPDYLNTEIQDKTDYALIVRYVEARTAVKNLIMNSIQVQAPQLKSLVRRVFRRVPGAVIDQQDLEFQSPFHPFFHQWPAISALYKQDSDRDLGALMGTIREEFGEDMRDSVSMVKNGSITFKLLWTLFPPGCPVLGTWEGQLHCFLVNEARYIKEELTPMFTLNLLLLDHDGSQFGWRRIPMFVSAFAGSQPVSTLPCVPVYFQDDALGHLQTLFQRGSAATDLLNAQPAYRNYEGFMTAHTSFDEDVEIWIEGRVIVDVKAHSQCSRRNSPTVHPIAHKLECLIQRDALTKLVTDSADEDNNTGLISVLDNLNHHPVLRHGSTKLVPLSPGRSGKDSDPLRAHRWTASVFGLHPEVFLRSVVRGYCLSTKSWGEFEVSCIGDIRWNTHAFDALVIPPARKRLLEALVKQQQTHKADVDVDDVVSGKGQGLIMLLSGPPGTGKTLTAESVADRLQLPLYSVSANELGDSAKEIETQFGQVLRLAAGWNAVLLLDEADAFLEKREDTPAARDRNKRVAAFLRILEYYKGILILTTNRFVNFDDAFYSRIHLNLNFRPLDYPSRVRIWNNFLRDAEINPKEIAVFAQQELNGRQIKNVMKMARLLAKDTGERLQGQHVLDVFDVVLEGITQES